MPWRPIQTATAGWLSLLGLKNLGKNPDTILEDVRPTAELTDYWLRGASEAHQESKTMVFTNESLSATFLQASEQEWIYVHRARGSLYAVAPATPTHIMATLLGQGLISVWQKGPVPTVLLTADGYANVDVADLWIPPGFLLNFTAWSAVGDGITVGALITRLRV